MDTGVFPSTKPPQCDSLADYAPLAYFCIDPISDTIYMTREALQFRMQVGKKFELDVLLKDTASNRKTVTTLELTITGSCGSAAAYNDLIASCMFQYGTRAAEQWDTVTKSVMFAAFDGVDEQDRFQELVSVSLDISKIPALQNQELFNVKLNAEGVKEKRLNNILLKSSTTYMEDIKDINVVNATIDPGFHPPRQNRISLQVTDAAGIVVVMPITAVNMQYIVKYRCDQQCVSDYERWKGLAEVSKSSNLRCGQDPRHMRQNYETCLSVGATFQPGTKPKISKENPSEQNLTLSSVFYLGGCKYTSPYNIPDDDIYLLRVRVALIYTLS